jgi:hypothetical protein
MKLNISSREFIALYALLTNRSTVAESDAEPLKQLSDRMKAYLITALTKASDNGESRAITFEEWEANQKLWLKEMSDKSDSKQQDMLVIPSEELDALGNSSYPKKTPPQPNMPHHGGKHVGKKRNR